MKDNNEIKAIINKFLQNNSIKGYLYGDVLYMQSLGKGKTLFTVLLTAGFIILAILLNIRSEELLFSNFGLFALLSMIIGGVGVYMTKSLLVYDINKNTLYTANCIGKKEFGRTKEIRLDTIKEIAVNNGYLVPNKSPAVVLDFKGELLDNPQLTTLLSGLTNGNKLVDMCEPAASREPYLVAVERGKMLAECLDINCTICNKDEYVHLTKNENGETVLTKSSRVEEWKKAKRDLNMLLVFFIVILISGLIFLFYMLG